jgi:hypothetical protein
MFWNRKRKAERPDGGHLSVIGTTDPTDMGGTPLRHAAVLRWAVRFDDVPVPTHTAWFDRPDADQHIDALLAREKITPDEVGHLCDFVKNGFVVLEGLLGGDLVDRVNGEIDDAVAKGYQGYQRGSSQRIEHLLHTMVPIASCGSTDAISAWSISSLARVPDRAKR